MQAVVEVLKASLRPSSVTFLIAMLSVGVLLSFPRRTQRIARWYFAALLAMYWIVSAS